VLPRTARVTVASMPAGLQIDVDGQPQSTPFEFTGVVGMTRNLSASPQVLNGTPWEWQTWSDGGAATHDVSTPAVNTTYTATFSIACPEDVSSSVELTSLSVTRLGTTQLFLQWLTLRNTTATAIQGPLVLVLGDLQNAVVVGAPIMTSCGPAASNPGVIVHAGDDQLGPGEVALVPLVIYKVGLGAIATTLSVLSGLPAR
jgi:hypothetical protein